MSGILVTGMWQCQDCGETGPVEPMESGDTVRVDHRCDYMPGEDENW